MPIIGTVDVAVHLHRVYNIDLFCRGVYYLRVSVVLPAKVRRGDAAANAPHKGERGTHNSSGGPGGIDNSGGFMKEDLEAQGIPYMCLAQCAGVDTMVGHKKVPPMKEHRLQGPAVHGHCYHSRMFIIRYREEELELGEVVNFQIPVELDAGRRWLEAGQKLEYEQDSGQSINTENFPGAIFKLYLVLQMELMFSKLASLEKDTTQLATNGMDASNHDVEEDTDEVLRMEPVAVQRFEASLSGGHWGIHGYVPVTFSGVHFVRVDCMVHGVLRNLKLESPIKYDETNRESPEENQAESYQDVGTRIGSVGGGERLPPSFARSDSRGSAQESVGASGHGSTGSDRSIRGRGRPPIAVDQSKSKLPPRRKYTWFSLYDEQSASARHRRLGSDKSDRSSASGASQSDGFQSKNPSRGDVAAASGHGQDAAVPSKEEGSQHPLGWRWGWGRKASGLIQRVPPPEAAAKPGDTPTAAPSPLPQSSDGSRATSPGTGQGDAAIATVESCIQAGDNLVGTGDEKEREYKRQEKAQKSAFEMATECVRLPSGEGDVRGEENGVGERADRDAGLLEKRDAAIVLAQIRKRKDVYSYFVMPLVRALEAQATTKAWLRKLLETEAQRTKLVPKSARPLWGKPDDVSGRDILRVLRRLFVPECDLETAGLLSDRSKPPLATGIGSSLSNGGDSVTSEVEGEGTAAGCSISHELPTMASVAFPSLINRYRLLDEGGVWDEKLTAMGRIGVALTRLEWLETDEQACKAVEEDVHSLAMLGFVEWREFVSALPGCGEILSRETSALWLAQIRQRWACQTTLHTCGPLQQGASGTGSLGTEAPTGQLQSLERSRADSTQRSPRFSYLETEIGSENFGTAVRMACADASAPYKLPLQDQQMFPEPESLLPVCLVQRYTSPVEDDASGEMTGYDRVAAFEAAAAMEDAERERASEMGQKNSENDPPTSPVWVSAFQRNSSTLPVVSPERESPPKVGISPSGSPRRSPPPSSRRRPKNRGQGSQTDQAVSSPLARSPPRAPADTPRTPSLETVTAAAAGAAAAALVAPVSDDSSSVASSMPSTPSPVPYHSQKQGSGSLGRNRTRSLSPLAKPADDNGGASGARAGDKGVHAPPRLVRTGKSRSSRLPSPPSSLPVRSKSSKSLSPFFGSKGLAFLSPISKRRPRHWEGVGAVAKGDSRRSGLLDDEERGMGLVHGMGGTHAPSEGGAIEANGELAESPIVVPPGGSFRADKTKSSTRTLPSPSPTPRSPTSQGLSGYASTDSIRVRDLPTPSRGLRFSRSPSSSKWRSRSASPARPPLKQMTERRQRERKDSDEGSGRGVRDGAEGKKGAAGTSADGDGGEGSAAAASSSGASAFGRTRRSLLDGVEQSSDLGAFFRQGEVQDNNRRRGRVSPRSRTARGKGCGSSRRNIHAPSTTGRRGDFGGYFGGHRLPSKSDRRHGKHRSHHMARDKSFAEGEDDDDDDDDEEEEGVVHHGAGAGVHVIVLHHGYCGSSMDMRLIKNYIRILAPNALVLNAESNERDQHTSMRIMGENLAKEIYRFLIMRAPSVLIRGGQGRLSFIAHSAGAIIVRVALTSKTLRPALRRLHLFVSLGSPHLGTLYGASGIVRTGMWAMKRWTKSQLLEEIGLTDAAHPKDSLLCKLSREAGLEYFRHVVLVSADKDGYVPPQSARVQMCDASIRDARKGVPHGQVVCEMAQSILAPIRDENLYRLHLWGGSKAAAGGGGGVDEYIGRAAHISMMDSPSLVCLLLCTLLDLIR